MVISILGFIIGYILGQYLNFSVPNNYTMYLSISTLACIHVIFNGYINLKMKKFITKAFLVEFIITILVGLIASYIGILLNVPLHTGFIFVFCFNLYRKINVLIDFQFYNKDTATDKYIF